MENLYYEIVKDIKEKMCYIAQDYETEMKEYENKTKEPETFDLPDGQTITSNTRNLPCFAN